MSNFIYSFDLSVFGALDKLHTPFLDNCFKAVTHLGDGGTLWIILAVVLLIFRRTRPCGLAIAFALIAVEVLNNNVIKNLVARPRPYTKYDIVALIPHPRGYSFPSGHTSGSFASVLALTFTLHKAAPYGAGLARKPYTVISACLITLASLIAFSRIWLRVHYCTDVLGGIIFGLIYAIIGVILARVVITTLKRVVKRTK